MKRKLLTALVATLAITGCQSTSNTATEQATASNNILARCDLPTIENDRGYVKPSLYAVGTFEEGQWMHMEHRKMSYKGDGIYQVVVDEKAATVNLQFATIGWKPQYTAAGRSLEIGYEKELKKGGFMKDTKVTIAEDGKYVWSIQVDANKDPIRALIAKCD